MARDINFGAINEEDGELWAVEPFRSETPEPEQEKAA